MLVSVITIIILHLLLLHCAKVMASDEDEFLQAWLTRRRKQLRLNLPRVGSQRTQSVTTMSREGWLQCCPLSYDQACCMPPPFVKCYAIQVFFVTSDFDPQLMLTEKNQVANWKVCTVIQSFLFHLPNHDSGQLRLQKCHPFLTCPWKINIVYDITYLELTVWDQCRLSTLWHDSKMGRPACNSRRCEKLFLLDHAIVSTIRQAHLESPASDGQHIPREPPGK